MNPRAPLPEAREIIMAARSTFDVYLSLQMLPLILLHLNTELNWSIVEPMLEQCCSPDGSRGSLTRNKMCKVIRNTRCFVCVACGESFSGRRSLRKHLKRSGHSLSPDARANLRKTMFRLRADVVASFKAHGKHNFSLLAEFSIALVQVCLLRRLWN